MMTTKITDHIARIFVAFVHFIVNPSCNAVFSYLLEIQFPLQEQFLLALT